VDQAQRRLARAKQGDWVWGALLKLAQGGPVYSAVDLNPVHGKGGDLAFKDAHDVYQPATITEAKTDTGSRGRLAALTGQGPAGVLAFVGGIAGIIALLVAVIMLAAGGSGPERPVEPGTLPPEVLQQLSEFNAYQGQIQSQSAELGTISQRLEALESGAGTGAGGQAPAENQQRLAGLNNRIKELMTQLAANQKRLDRFAKQLEPLDPLPKTIAGLNTGLQAASQRISETQQRLGQLAKRIEPLDPLPPQLAGIDKRLEAVAAQLKETQQQLADVSQQTTSLAALAPQLAEANKDLADARGARKQFQETQLEAMAQLQSQIDVLKGNLGSSGGGQEQFKKLQLQALTQFQEQLGALKQQLSEAVKNAQRFEEQQLQVMAQFQGRMDQIESGQDKLLKTVKGVDRQIQTAGTGSGEDLEELEKALTSQISSLQGELKSLQKKTQALERGVKRVSTKAQVHRVRPGETLYMIARRYNVTVTQLRRYNSLSKKATIYPGQQLVIRPAKSN
jgi:LysM repeat protein